MLWYLGLGANLGDARLAFEQVVFALPTRAAACDVKLSSIWQSAPVNAVGPDYLNAVISFHSTLEPLDMLVLAQDLETEAGRTRPYRNAPRTLDIDLLLADRLTVQVTALRIPHPRMHERAFVLAPLLELDPDCQIPGRGSAAKWLACCSNQPITRVGQLATTGPNDSWQR